METIMPHTQFKSIRLYRTRQGEERRGEEREGEGRKRERKKRMMLLPRALLNEG